MNKSKHDLISLTALVKIAGVSLSTGRRLVTKGILKPDLKTSVGFFFLFNRIRELKRIIVNKPTKIIRATN